MLDINLPKGMDIPELAEKKQKPIFLSLREVNYAGMIQQALNDLPLEISMDECWVIERPGQMPEVKLTLTVFGEKECCYKVGETG